jgi:transposase InsO family protein
LFGISRQGYYQRQQRVNKRLLELQEVKAAVIAERIYLPRLGTRKLYYRLKEQFRTRGIKIGRDELFAFLRSEHLLVKPKRSYHKTTNSKHWLHKYPNLLKNRKPEGVDQIWVSDITYIDTIEKTAYLSLITDAYSRKIVGYHLHESLHTDGVAAALQMAVKGRARIHPLIHHSDRGLQYCSSQYQQLLYKHRIIPSMTDGYDCYQNALAERINGILKEEFLIIKPKDITQAKQLIDQSIKLYNERRPHLALNYQTPEQIHQKKSLPVVSDKDYIYS